MKTTLTLCFTILSILGGIHTTSAQVNWTTHPANPIIVAATFDPVASELYDPCVLFDGEIYKMWYTRKVAGTEKIAYATSPDGLAWSSVDTAVIVPVTKWSTRFDSKKVGQGSVVRDGDTLKMWYWGDGPNIGNIGLAWSLTGASWTRIDGGNADLSAFNRTNDGSTALAVVTPCVLKVGNLYHMWYTRYWMTTWNIAYATSINGIQWTNIPGSGTEGCVLEGTAGRCDEALVGYPCVLPTPTGFEMWYTAVDNSQHVSIAYATSTDGIHWQKYNGSGSKNALIDNGGVCSVLKDETGYKMWYSSSTNSQILYATAQITTVQQTTTTIPTSIQLYQNYPNPFNPVTSIRYQLSEDCNVTLTVYNSLGQEVQTIVNEKQERGVHIVPWNATNMPSGVYVYKLIAGSSVQTKKMVVLK